MPGLLRKSNKDSQSFFSRMGAAMPSLRTKSTKATCELTKAERKPSQYLAIKSLQDVRAARSRGNSEEIFLGIEALNTDRPPRNWSSVYELIPGKLCMAFHPNQSFSRAEIIRRPELFFFSTDLHERYVPFCKDFGPVSCGIIYRFWKHVRSKEHHPNLRQRPLVYYTDDDEKNHANAAVLLGAYMMLEHNMTAAEAAQTFENVPGHPFLPFRDATFAAPDFGITLRDCLCGLEKAMCAGWFDKATFNADQYEELEDPDGGDVSLLGDKFVAFRGPKLVADEDDSWTCPPSFYFSLFKELGVTTIVRLNEPDCYDKSDFEQQGLRVHDLEFPDCTCPSPALVEAFLDIVDAATGRVAVHCRAGLGRTGTMIGLWMMKNLHFTAREAIGFMRICRPGCVIGQQQHFLVACDRVTWDGNFLSPLAFHRSSSAASGAATPLAGVLKMAAPSKKEVESKEELGRQIEQASRKRELRRKKVP